MELHQWQLQVLLVADMAEGCLHVTATAWTEGLSISTCLAVLTTAAVDLLQRALQQHISEQHAVATVWQLEALRVVTSRTSGCVQMPATGLRVLAGHAVVCHCWCAL